MSDDSINNMLVRLKEYRKAMNLSQTRIAEKLGVRQTYYSQIETGEISLSYNILNNLHQNNCDIDYIITGIQNRSSDNLLLRLLDICDKSNVKKLYIMMVTGFLQIWEWDFNKHWEKCLYSELRAMNVLIINNAELNDRLYFIRVINNISQQTLSNILGIGRTKCGKCEHGKKKLDAELMLFLYHVGYALPSFFFEDFAGIAEISYLLDQNKEKKEKYYIYLSSLLRSIVKNEDALHLLQKSGVNWNEKGFNS